MSGKIFFYEDGSPSLIPTCKADAKRFKQLRYITGELCEQCSPTKVADGARRSKYVKNDRCTHCARLEAIDFYNLAVGASIFDNSKGSWCVYFERDDCDRDISDEDYARLSTELERFDGVHAPAGRQEALELGVGLYVHPDPCKHSGHLGMRTLKGDCLYCEQERNTPSARQAAVAAGERWYTPDDDCKRCGTRSERRVSDGRCKGCSTADATPDARQTPDSIMMEANPDMAISKADADAYGFKVFRTGKPCTKGHKGWRYVSTGGCIDCLRG